MSEPEPNLLPDRGGAFSDVPLGVVPLPVLLGCGLSEAAAAPVSPAEPDLPADEIATERLFCGCT